eukprot:scaffold36137_cov53-Phaeocystis_antarctica.AAC.2
MTPVTALRAQEASSSDIQRSPDATLRERTASFDFLLAQMRPCAPDSPHAPRPGTHPPALSRALTEAGTGRRLRNGARRANVRAHEAAVARRRQRVGVGVGGRSRGGERGRRADGTRSATTASYRRAPAPLALPSVYPGTWDEAHRWHGGWQHGEASIHPKGPWAGPKPPAAASHRPLDHMARTPYGWQHACLPDRSRL